MRIIAFVTSYWNSQEEFDIKHDGQFGLGVWAQRMLDWFSPVHSFICCGTWSEPLCAVKKLPWVSVVNSGLELTKPYDPYFQRYDLCCYSAAMHYALNRNDWDLLVELDTDVLVGSVDFRSLLNDFMKMEDYEILSPAWCEKYPGGPFSVRKRSAAVRYVNNRQRPNLLNQVAWEKEFGSGKEDPKPMLSEEEFAIVHEGRWWNPWPKLGSCRQEYNTPESDFTPDEQVMHWPFVRRPSPSVIQPYNERHQGGQIPV